MNAIERLGKLVDALNEFVAEGNNDVHPEKVQKEFTAVMKAAHTLSFSAVDVATKLEAGEGIVTEVKENGLTVRTGRSRRSSFPGCNTTTTTNSFSFVTLWHLRRASA